MPLYSVTTLPDEIKKETVHVMNYTTHDFSMEYLDDKNTPHTVTIPALSTEEFPQSLGQIVITHLANFILNLEDFHYKTDPKIEIQKIKEKVTISE